MILEELKKEFNRRVFEESYVRIDKCLNVLSEEEIWFRPNDSMNSVGNLILHLCGNARQWICNGLTDQPDFRERNEEFKPENRCSKSELKQLMHQLNIDILASFKKLNEADLFTERPVQVFSESGFSILIHVIEHFSYHTGQITLLTKLLKNLDLKYYGDIKLD